MAILPAGISSWFNMGGSNQPLPKWWRWVMLLILVYSSTISVLTGQVRAQRLPRPKPCQSGVAPPSTVPAGSRGAPSPTPRVALPCVGHAAARRASRHCPATARGSNTFSAPPQGFSSISVDAAKYYDTSEVVINTLVTASNVAQIVVVRPCCRSLAWPWGG